MTDTTLTRTGWPERLAQPLMAARGFFFFVSAVLAAQWLIRSLAFPGTGGDDGEQLVFAQYVAIGYFPRNPPLYSWLVIAAEQVFGVSVLAVAAVKFLSIWGTCAALFASGRIVFRDDRYAALAGLSPLAMYLVFWDSVTGLTDSALAMLLCALTFLIFLKLRERPHWGWYAALGAAAGLGMLSKYGYGIFLLSLTVAACFDQTARRRLLRMESILALATMAAIVAPYGLWFIDHRHETMASDTKVGIAAGIGFLAGATAGALTPLWLMLPLFFPRAFRRVSDALEERAALRRLIGIQLIWALVFLAVAVAVSGLKARGYYMFVLILLPLWFFARVQAGGWRGRAATQFALAAAAIPVVAAGALAAKAYFEPMWCEKCERQLPYDAWSRQLRAAGFTHGTIVADWWPYPLDGNIKVRFPEARVVTVKHPHAIPPMAEVSGSCLLLWGSPERRNNVVGFANDRLAAGIGQEQTSVLSHVTAPVRFTEGKHQVSLYYLLLKDGAGRCR
jgi:4-amino-4-deoxy-L-arabinose transferase-like glycosyltransferase